MVCTSKERRFFRPSGLDPDRHLNARTIFSYHISHHPMNFNGKKPADRIFSENFRGRSAGHRQSLKSRGFRHVFQPNLIEAAFNQAHFDTQLRSLAAFYFAKQNLAAKKGDSAYRPIISIFPAGANRSAHSISSDSGNIPFPGFPPTKKAPFGAFQSAASEKPSRRGAHLSCSAIIWRTSSFCSLIWRRTRSDRARKDSMFWRRPGTLTRFFGGGNIVFIPSSERPAEGVYVSSASLLRRKTVSPY